MFNTRRLVQFVAVFGLVGMILSEQDAFASGVRPLNTGTNKAYIVENQILLPDEKVSYPVVKGLTNLVVENRINQLFKKTALSGLNVSSGQLGAGDQYMAQYTLLMRAGRLLEMMFLTYYYANGAAHGMPNQVVQIVNLKNGDVYHMQDLFKSKSSYLQAISQQVRKKEKNHELNSFQKFTGVTQKDGFYITNEGFVIYFYPYEWTPYALGFPEYQITYQQVMPFINKNGALWKALHSPWALKAEENVKLDLAKVRSMGYYPIPRYQAQTLLAKGQTMYAFTASPYMGAFNDQLKQAVFFFIGHQFIHVETLKKDGPVINVYPVNLSNIAVTYATANNPSTVSFHLTGTKLVETSKDSAIFVEY